ncbi:hypothetical protein HYW43_04210 [Candidatus Daviesbacteria bacterium]|nr:hypothetical protein [Candidatus Daviesbacteria bacterium]
MKKLPLIIIGIILILALNLFLLRPAFAVAIASQTESFSDILIVWQTIQELGNNLSGTLDKFTFRISTQRSNLNQFNYTATNTRIYDKDAGNNIVARGCYTGNPNNSLRGLTFNTSGVPSGYEDVTIDFSCNNYNFIPGHRYLILVTNANMGNSGSGEMFFASAAYGPGGKAGANDFFNSGGLRYANSNKYDYYHNGGSCNPVKYIWNDQTRTPVSGCNIWTSGKDDIYFILSNTAPPPPPPRLPVVFIPGIGGSEFKANQDIYWSKDDGHGGIYSHAYASNEQVWVNQDEAIKLGDDDYFDILKLKPDGQTPEADLTLTGNLTSFGYSDIDSFFEDMGYVKDTNFFVFPYDWRKDIRNSKDDLDNLIELAKQKSGQSEVNLVVHSMGGLIARYYISDSQKAGKVNKLIELGVPHLGATSAVKTLMYGFSLQKNVFGFIPIGIPATEVKDLSQNNPGLYQLLPSNQYFSYYSNSDMEHPYPLKDDRDIDNNKVTGSLNFDQIKNLLTNLNYNMTVFGFGEQLHNTLDSILNQTNGTKVYEIVGTAQPTLGQIHETWWITWPINLIPRTDEIYINGDDTVPLYSASLKNDSLDLSGANKIYYVEQRHADLVSQNGAAMQTVKAILNDDNSLPVEVKDQKIILEGKHISLDDGELDLYDDQNRHCGLNSNSEIEENIPEVTCTASSKTKHAFVKKKSSKVKVKTTRKNKTSSSPKTTNIRIRHYNQDKISKTTLYKDVPVTEIAKVDFTLDPTVDTAPALIFYPDETKVDNTIIAPTIDADTGSYLDQTPPVTTVEQSGSKDEDGKYLDSTTITLNSSDSESGVLKIEYSLDNGETVNTYTDPFVINTGGQTTIQVTSTDNLGNQEVPQTITVEIVLSPTPTPTPTPTAIPSPSSTSEASNESNPSNSSNNSTQEVTTLINTISLDTIARGTQTPLSVDSPANQSISSSPSILGVNFQNPTHIADQLTTSNLLNTQTARKIRTASTNSVREILGGLLVVSGGLISLVSLGLIATFLKPIPE